MMMLLQKLLISLTIILIAGKISVISLSSDIKQAVPNFLVCPKSGGELVTLYTEVNIPTLKGIHFTDITPNIRSAIETSGVSDGQVNVISRHTTTAITINEMEVRSTENKRQYCAQYYKISPNIHLQGRLIDDTRQFLLKLAPAAYPYLHNDLHLRHGPPDWPGGDDAWREQEPINAHSHLLSMILGASVTVPIHEKKLKIGTWQSVILVSQVLD